MLSKLWPISHPRSANASNMVSKLFSLLPMADGQLIVYSVFILLASLKNNIRLLRPLFFWIISLSSSFNVTDYMANNPLSISLYLLVYYSSFSSLLFGHALNTITKGQSMKDNETLVSVDETFELAFFSPGNSSLLYVGVRYHKIQDKAVIWVANRGRPISDRNGVLTIGEDGNLMIQDGNLNSVWSSNVLVESKSPVLSLNVTGNLILSGNDGNRSKIYWQSFSDPTDTNLPKMKIYVSSIPGENRAFTSWKSEDDPSPGSFAMGVDTGGMPQIVIWEKSRRIWRSGPWNAQMFTGVPTASGVTNQQYGFKLSYDDAGNYFTYVPRNASDLIRIRLSWDGYGEQLKWNVSRKKWVLMQKQPANVCDYYNYCGKFGVCSESDPKKCSCIDGFQPRNPDQWKKGNWAGGCERKSPLKCHQRNSSVAGESSAANVFKELKYMKLPDFGDLETTAKDNESCRQICLNRYSCNAFAYVSQIGCMIWMQDLIDVQKFNTVGNILYLKQSLGECKSDTIAGKKRNMNLIISIPVIVGSVIMAVWAFFIWKWMRAQRERKRKKWEIILSQRKKADSGFLDGNVHGENMSQVNLEEVPLFSLQELVNATYNFNVSNKLGQGGFGPVYKGKLPSGQEIAVKRLSTASSQGLQEFINEVVVISKLQHRNLVRLFGCCVDGDEKLLVYEYMPNKSLDALLFDPLKRECLDWGKRFNIVEGICRGLIYLHRDSRLRIIHRDMKASNILLDEDLNPKISDFGMARIFGGNEEQANTMRVVGTYGYMSPEYAMEGRFSEKSDVYSFGVLLLEIVSGRRNTSFYGNEQAPSLLGFAWKLWNEGNIASIIAPAISDPCFREEIFRCIHVGLLCVQEFAKDRPAMSTVMSMLNSEIVDLPTPRQPAFSVRQILLDTDESVQPSPTGFSVNHVTISVVTGR